MSEFETVTYQDLGDGVVQIMQNRPDARNAQDLQLTYDLDAALMKANQDENVRCIILGGNGPHFSSGHDFRSFKSGKKIAEDFPVVNHWSGFRQGGVHSRISYEHEIYLEMTRRWRDLPKPTIAMVQGKCIAGGLALAWACDLIVASDDAMFVDPVVMMGVCGIEYFAHPYELGIRKAKELLFTGDNWSAEEGHRLGMINHVVPREELENFTQGLAKRIAEKNAFALAMTKQAVNIAQDNMGMRQTMDAVFGLHHLCHAHSIEMLKKGVRPEGVPEQFGGTKKKEAAE